MSEWEELGERIEHGRPVQIRDVDIPFWSLVALMVKVVIASIPAAIIIFLLGVLVTFLIGTIGSVL